MLHKYFIVGREDQVRIAAVVRTVNHLADRPDWVSCLAQQREHVEHLVWGKTSLLTIATQLEVPIDELEKFCFTSLSPILRTQAKLLDMDVAMYRKPQLGLTKREARRLAYNDLKADEDYRRHLWAIRMVLGASKQHFQELRDHANSYGKEQVGLGPVLPASQTKHYLNRIVCDAFRKAHHKQMLAIFEPTQGYGDGTALYAHYGLVVSVEKSEENFDQALQKHSQHAADLDVYVREGWTIDELLARHRREQHFNVLMPTSATDSAQIVPNLRQARWRFDVIDVDPFDDVYDMVDAVLPLLADVSLLYVSVNPNPRYGRTKKAAKTYREQDTPEFRERLWMYDCRRYMWQAVKEGFALVPIVVHKCWTSTEQKGIDRIYFAAIRSPECGYVVQQYVDRTMLLIDKVSPIQHYQPGTVPIVQFGIDVDSTAPDRIRNVDVIEQRLRLVLAKHW